MGDDNFRPPQNPHPLTDYQKFGTCDYVGGPTAVPNLVQICPGGLLGKWVKYNDLFIYLFIYTFFRELTYRSDPLTDFHTS